jgi:hypothetical protein
MKPLIAETVVATNAVGAVAVAALVAVACATAPLPAPRPLALTIAPGKDAEECVKLDAGERIDYEFRSSESADFNLHTHRGGQLVMPVDVKRTRAHSGTFVSGGAEGWCLMWTNEGQQPASVTGWWRRLPR